MTEFFEIFANNIFSIAVAAYLLIYMHDELKKLNENIIRLSEKIEKLCK